MKVILFIFIMAYSFYAKAWECPELGDNFYDLDRHWQLATNVFWGRVVEGKYFSERRPTFNIDFKVAIYDTFKGDAKPEAWLTTSHESLFHGVELGGNYLIFLYGNNEVDFCGILISLPSHRETVGRLIEYYSHDLDDMPKPMMYVLKKTGKIR